MQQNHRPVWLSLLVALVLYLGLSGLQSALSAEPQVIAILDMERILRESKAAKTLRTEVDKRRTTFQAELQDQENALRAADQELSEL